MVDANKVVQNYCFPVEKRFCEAENTYEIVHGHSGRRISKVSDRYKLVTNEEVLMPLIKVFGAENIAKLFCWGGQMRNMFVAFTTGRSLELTHGRVIKEVVIAENSYDKSRTFKFLMGALDAICSNQLYNPRAVISYKKIHVGEIPVQQMINDAVANYRNETFDNWKRMAAMPLNNDEVVQGIANITKSLVPATEQEMLQPEYLRDSVRRNSVIRNMGIRQHYREDQSGHGQRSVWGVYSAINFGIAQAFWGKSYQGKRMALNSKMEDDVMKHFNLN